MELNNYLLDVVFSVEGGVRMRTYKIAATDSAKAFGRFCDEEETDFPIVYEGEVTPAIIVGIQQAQ